MSPMYPAQRSYFAKDEADSRIAKVLYSVAGDAVMIMLIVFSSEMSFVCRPLCSLPSSCPTWKLSDQDQHQNDWRMWPTERHLVHAFKKLMTPL